MAVRKEEREEEQASSEEGCGGPGLLLPLRMASPPRPLRLLSRTGHSTQVAKHVLILNHLQSLQTLFPFFHCY